MARNGSGVYSLPSGYNAITGETILAAQHNTPLEDLAADANIARPIVAGGTGATTAAAARTNLGVPGLTTENTYSAAQTFNGANTYTGLQTISSTSPELRFVETDRTEVNYVPAWLATANSFRIQLRGVAGGAVDNNAYIMNYTSAGAAVSHFFGIGTSTVARIDDGGTGASFTTTIMTREKGDARFAAVSSRAFKTDFAAPGAVDFDAVSEWAFTYTDESPARAGQRSRGLVLEDLMAAGLPEVALGDGRVDWGPVIGAMWGEIVRLRERVASLEAAEGQHEGTRA